MSEKTTIARIRSDGTVVEVLSDGSERSFPEMPMRPMAEEEIEAAALSDPDARPVRNPMPKGQGLVSLPNGV